MLCWRLRAVDGWYGPAFDLVFGIGIGLFHPDTCAEPRPPFVEAEWMQQDVVRHVLEVPQQPRRVFIDR